MTDSVLRPRGATRGANVTAKNCRKVRSKRSKGLLVCSPPHCPRALLLEVLKALLCLIPPGYVTSYGQLAKVLGIPPRLIGALLAANDEPIKYPCHRVVMSDGRIGGYSGPCGVKLKEKLLMLEGVRLSQGKVDKTAFYDISTVLLSASEVG